MRSGFLIRALATVIFSGAANAGEITLHQGDPAPTLFASHWINGDAVPSFQKGTIYVIECWATWCGPCREMIPHVSALNTQFKDKGVTFIGMAIAERNPAGVEAFVKKKGAKMNYRVAVDAPAPNNTLKGWMTAVGQSEIPWSFVVDRDGKVAWIGEPGSLEPILQQVVDGTYDIKKQPEIAARRAEFLTRLEKADAAKDGDTYIAIADEMIAFDPYSSGALGLAKFKALFRIKKDYPAAYGLAKKLFENELKNTPDALSQMAGKIVEAEGVFNRDLDLALRMALRADALTSSENVAVLEVLARAYFEKGQIDKAVETQTAAVGHGGNDADLVETLKKYKAGK